jgi:hypothetical protein
MMLTIMAAFAELERTLIPNARRWNTRRLTNTDAAPNLLSLRVMLQYVPDSLCTSSV